MYYLSKFFNKWWISFIFLQANTDVLVGVKAEMRKPPDDAPDKGYLEFSVYW